MLNATLLLLSNLITDNDEELRGQALAYSISFLKEVTAGLAAKEDNYPLDVNCNREVDVVGTWWGRGGWTSPCTL